MELQARHTYAALLHFPSLARRVQNPSAKDLDIDLQHYPQVIHFPNTTGAFCIDRSVIDEDAEATTSPGPLNLTHPEGILSECATSSLTGITRSSG